MQKQSIKDIPSFEKKDGKIIFSDGIVLSEKKIELQVVGHDPVIINSLEEQIGFDLYAAVLAREYRLAREQRDTADARAEAARRRREAEIKNAREWVETEAAAGRLFFYIWEDKKLTNEVPQAALAMPQNLVALKYKSKHSPERIAIRPFRDPARGWDNIGTAIHIYGLE